MNMAAVEPVSKLSTDETPVHSADNPCWLLRGGAIPEWRGMLDLAFSAKKITLGEMRVLLHVDDMIGAPQKTRRPGELWAANAYIAEECNASVRTVENAISKAVKLGLIVRKKRQDGMSRWRALPCTVEEAQQRISTARDDRKAAREESRRQTRTEQTPAAPIAPLAPRPALTAAPAEREKGSPEGTAEVLHNDPYKAGMLARKRVERIITEDMTADPSFAEGERAWLAKEGGGRDFHPIRNVMATRMRREGLDADEVREAITREMRAAASRLRQAGQGWDTLKIATATAKALESAPIVVRA